ncbi:CHAT domain-containing protein [Actinoplanes sp. NPDC048988]|uniref:CHAT domain-containing protein n=1 Tax=Actinoplanes sp. NPDC048988 TaxID=3363901 RepID=UPI003713D8C6
MHHYPTADADSLSPERSVERALAPKPKHRLDGRMTSELAGPLGPDIDRRMALAREWDELVEQVRQLDGFEDFLRPPRLETLLPAATDGPVVILNVSRWRCDALIVELSGVRAVPLPDLTQQDVTEQVNGYLSAVQAYETETQIYQQADHEFTTGDRDLPSMVTLGEATARWGQAGERLETALRNCLRWMWDTFVERIMTELSLVLAASGMLPRIWWCPTGALTLLPIHAAGRHDQDGQSVLDRAVSSYTPTLRALLEARGAPGTESGRMLFVGLAETPGRRRLPNVAAEAELIGDLVPSDRRAMLVEQDATRDRVLEELPNCPWVHFSCHGDQNLTDPSHGGLALYDGMLTVTDISTRQFDGELAYLSGCKTAVGGSELPDEAITLAAALHYTGYRHVIATLWSVADRHAAQVAADVYRSLVQDGRFDAATAAHALHEAVQNLRRENRDRPSLWTPFAHTGP